MLCVRPATQRTVFSPEDMPKCLLSVWSLNPSPPKKRDPLHGACVFGKPTSKSEDVKSENLNASPASQKMKAKLTGQKGQHIEEKAASK